MEWAVMRIEAFVAERNLSLFRQQLERATAPQTQATFKQLLQQLEVLDLRGEQLGTINRHIEGLRQLIAKQVELIEELRLGGRDLERPVIVLAALNALMAVYQAHRQRIRAAIASGYAGADAR
jgi:hypothetical protein